MRRDPLSIVSILIQTLENINENEAVNFNELSNRSNLHWETVKRYLFLIKHIQNLAPIIEIEGNKLVINKKVKNEHLDIQTKLMLTLFYSKAFHEDTAIDLVNPDSNLIRNLINDGLIQESNNKFYLTDYGKRATYKIYRKNRDIIYENYLQLQSNLPPQILNSPENIDTKIEKLTKKVQEIDSLSSKLDNIENILNENLYQIPPRIKPPIKEKEPILDNAGSIQVPETQLNDPLQNLIQDQSNESNN